MLSDDFQRVIEEWDTVIPEIELFQNEPISETDTRCKIIDPIIFKVMGWDQRNVTMEPKVESGYIDYYCGSKFTKFVIEAKRTAVPFKMPKGFQKVNSNKIARNNAELFAAIQQARSYAKEKECNFCIVSNGLNFAITKTYASEEEHDTIVLSGKEALRRQLYILFEIMSPYRNGNKYFSEYLESVGDTRTPPQFRKVLSNELYDRHRTIRENDLSPLLRGYIENYFRDVDTNKDLLNEVYCDTDKLEGYSQEIRSYLRERVPFFHSPVEEITVKDTTATGIGSQYKLKFQKPEDGHVFLLLGNLGAGKTTFINRFYTHILDEPTRNKLVWINIDFIKYNPETNIDKFTTDRIERFFRKEYSHFKLKSIEALTEMYTAELEEMEDGIWSLLSEEKIKEKKFEFFSEKMADKNEHIKNQINYIRSHYKSEVCIVLDNVDHHSTEVQTKILSFAFGQAKDLKSLIILSLRDETMWGMKGNLPANAFNNMTLYQIIPPDVSLMLQKRINLVKSLVGEEITYFDVLTTGTPKGVQVRKKEIFESIENTIRNHPTKELFERISSGNMRYALEFFSTMVTSGHTDLVRLFTNLVSKINPRLLQHWEVLKSIALGSHEIYNSDKSIITNLFNIFDDGFYSHFVLIRILEVLDGRRLQVFNHDVGKGYVPMSTLFKEVLPFCKNEEVLRQCLIPLLQSYLIDSDIGSRKPGDNNYYDKIKLIKLTPAGKYYLSELMGTFEYLEIVLHDTPIHNEQTYKAMYSNIMSLKRSQSLVDRWELRFQVVEQFLSYLEEEEERDLSYLSTTGMTKWGKVIPNIREIYDKDKAEIQRRISLQSKQTTK